MVPIGCSINRQIWKYNEFNGYSFIIDNNGCHLNCKCNCKIPFEASIPCFKICRSIHILYILWTWLKVLRLPILQFHQKNCEAQQKLLQLCFHVKCVNITPIVQKWIDFFVVTSKVFPHPFCCASAKIDISNPFHHSQGKLHQNERQV